MTDMRRTPHALQTDHRESGVSFLSDSDADTGIAANMKGALQISEVCV